MLYLLANDNSFQSEHHIRCPFKETAISLPAYTAFAVLQARKLLFHFSAAVGTGLIADAHITRFAGNLLAVAPVSVPPQWGGR